MSQDKFYKIIIVVLLLINVLTLAFLLIKEDHPERKLKPYELITERIDLTDEQTDKINAITKDLEHQLSLIKERESKLREDYFDAVRKDDTSTPLDLKGIALLNRQRDSLSFNYFRDVRSVCNEKQQLKFDQLLEELKSFYQP
jgi:periplasmic protein CpxP/Spy